MEQTIMMVMQTCQEYAQKATCHTLTEFEVLMYEQMSRLVATWCQAHELGIRQNLGELERDALKSEKEHQEWLRAQDDDEGDIQ